MRAKAYSNWRRIGLRIAAVAIGLVMVLGHAAMPVTAAGDTRTLWLYHTHTGKTGKFTFKRDGKYDQGVLRELNTFLADWRTKSVAKMDPALFDLLWMVYQDVGATQPYSIVSSYRDPKTNAMLASKSSGVADNSQHMTGKAMDVFIKGVPVAKLRATAMKYQVGGVGYYPTSGSPFVHMDTGSVRAWPRMTRAQLQDVFPDGRTLHLPVDGTPLSSKGRAYAQAEWNKCRTVPCNGAPAPRGGDTGIMVASLAPAQRSVATIPVAPTPMMRPAGALSVTGTPITASAAPLAAAIPMPKAAAMMVATADILPGTGMTALGAISGIDIAPQPRVLMTPRDEVLTAYAPDIAPDPGARRALDILIQRETAAAENAPVTAALPTTDARVAALTGTGLDTFTNIFDMTWSAVTEAGSRSAIANTLVSAAPQVDAMVGLKARDFDLIAPELDHVNETLVEPVLMSDMHFAVLYEPEGYLDNAAELGGLAHRLALVPDAVPTPRYDIFVVRTPLLVASR